MKKFLFFIFVIAAAAAVFYFYSQKKGGLPAAEPQVCFQDACFKVETADTLSERATGLMFRKNLDENRGMLFVFGREGIYPFWMKNTYIPLDIIWLDEEKRIVFIEKNAQPCLNGNLPAGSPRLRVGAGRQDCPNISPGSSAKYVLEINAGLSDKIGLKTGDKAVFTK